MQMTKDELQEWKDKAFHTKNESEWSAVMQEIKNAVEGDLTATTALHNYCKAVLPKKKDWWAKNAKKTAFTAKPKTMYSEDTDKAIGELARVLTKYFELKLTQETK